MLQTMGVTERLIDAAKGGDPVAFEALLETHYDRIYRAAWRATGSREDAQDVALDVCVKLGAALASFRAEASFTTWLHRIVLNAAADFRRAARAGEHVPLEDESDRLASRAESAEAGLIRQDLWSAVRALPPQQRDAVLLGCWSMARILATARPARRWAVRRPPCPGICTRRAISSPCR